MNHRSRVYLEEFAVCDVSLEMGMGDLAFQKRKKGGHSEDISHQCENLKKRHKDKAVVQTEPQPPKIVAPLYLPRRSHVGSLR